MDSACGVPFFGTLALLTFSFAFPAPPVPIQSSRSLSVLACPLTPRFSSRTAAATAREGGKVIEETLVQMRAIASSVDQTAASVRQLGQNSHEITKL